MELQSAVGRREDCLRRIAPFVGHFTLEGARYVAGELGAGTGEIFDAIAGLVEKSLIATRIDRNAEHSIGCWTRRAHMRLKNWRSMASSTRSSARHAEYVAGHLESQREMLSALPRAERVAAYSGQLSNVRAALEWSFGPHGDDEIATRLAAASTQVFLELSLLIECQAGQNGRWRALEDPHKNSRRAMEIYCIITVGLDAYRRERSTRPNGFCRALDIAVIKETLPTS